MCKDNHTRLSTAWLLDVFYKRKIDRHVIAVLALAVISSDGSGFIDCFSRDIVQCLAGFCHKDDVGAGNVLGVKPYVCAAGCLSRQLIIFLVVTADKNVMTVGKGELRGNLLPVLALIAGLSSEPDIPGFDLLVLDLLQLIFGSCRLNALQHAFEVGDIGVDLFELYRLLLECSARL